jgi:hypothetical protein
MKEQVILSILAQESSKSELRLQRYGKKKLRRPFCTRKWLGVFLKYFKNQGSSQNFCGLQLNYKETEGPLCKFPGIIDFQIYFSIENHGGLNPWLMD